MGSGTSRGKKVAPACVTELNVTKTGPGVASSKQDRSPFDRIKIQTASRAARSRAQPDSLSQGHDSDLSGEEEDGTVRADREDGEMVSVKKKRTFLRSKTYGLCHFSQEDAGDATSSAQRSEEPPGASKDVNKRNNMKQHTHGDLIQQYPSSQTFLVSGDLLESEPTKQKQQSSNSHHSSLTTPVILYDGSEEELMDTIEREFS